MVVEGNVQGSQQAYASPTPLFLTIDQGGHASRVLVFDQFGEQIVQVRRAVSVQHPRPDWVEQDADALLQSVQSALSEALEQLGDRRQSLVAAGLVTQRSNIVCWDRITGRALSPAISWQDRRAHRWMQGHNEHATIIRGITGLLPTAHYGASKIHWCLENLPGVKAARKEKRLACAPLASFLLFHLLKEQPFMVDAVNASRTLLWDKTSRRWSPELLKLFSLDTDYLPHGVPNRYDFGHLDVAGQTIPLTVCSGDQSAALFSMGMPTRGNAYLNMGTGAFMQCLSGVAYEKSPARLLQSVVWADSGQGAGLEASLQVVEATVNGAGSALALFEMEAGLSAQQSQSHCADWLASAKYIPLFLNGVAGLGSPFWRPEFESRFVGNHAATAELSEKWVAVMESILFLLQVNLEELQKENVALKRIVISGGLSVMNGVCQRLADLSGLPVVRPQQSEATARGLAFLLVNTVQKLMLEQDSLNNSNVTWVESAEHFRPSINSALHERYGQWCIALNEALNEGGNS